ncbi:MAG: hypothetical protein ACLFTT_11325 [Candidatus Hydrogenedentota bacterium]
MRLRKRRRQKKSFYGWVKWAPLFVAPLTVAMYEVYLGTQMRQNDYNASKTNTEIRRLEKSLELLTLEKARLERLDRLENQAPALALQAPNPSQLRVIYYDHDSGRAFEAEDAPAVRFAREEKPAGMAPVPQGNPLRTPGGVMPALDYGGPGLMAPPPATLATVSTAAQTDGADMETPADTPAGDGLDGAVGQLLGKL